MKTFHIAKGTRIWRMFPRGKVPRNTEGVILSVRAVSYTDVDVVNKDTNGPNDLASWYEFQLPKIAEPYVSIQVFTSDMTIIENGVELLT